MLHNYFFYHTCHDSELLRAEIFCLNEHAIDFQIANKADGRHAPVSVYDSFEADVLIHQKDFEKASPFLAKVIEQYSAHRSH